jgi:hypothetical protein
MVEMLIYNRRNLSKTAFAQLEKRLFLWILGILDLIRIIMNLQRSKACGTYERYSYVFFAKALHIKNQFNYYLDWSL